MSVTLDYLLSVLDPWLNDRSVEEICINRPGEIWIYSQGAFTRHAVPLTVDDIEDIAIVAAAERQQDVGNGQPLLSTDLVGRGRLQAVLEPCVAKGYPSLTIRRGSEQWPTLAELAAAGLFRNTGPRRRAHTTKDSRLIALYEAGKWEAFFATAVRAKKSIIGCGVTASGKTHFAKAMIGEIPLDERLITIEDSPELLGLKHPNRVQLYYAADGDGTKAADLVAASLRMRPSRLMLQEIRDGEAAIAFLTALQTGHKGMTTIHASHCEAAFDRLRVVIKQTPWGAAVQDADLKSQLHELVDIVVHSSREDGPFEVDEVYFTAMHQ